MAAPQLPKSIAPTTWSSSGTAGATMTGTAGHNQLAMNAPNMTAIGGAGDDTYIVYDSSDKVVEAAGGGIDTILTWGNTVTMSANVENLTLMGSANARATGNAGNNLIIANDGNDTIITGGGNDVLVAGKGASNFILTTAPGTTTWITNFKTAGSVLDTVDLYGYGFRGFAEVKSAMTQVGSDVRVALPGGQSLMLQGKTIDSITTKNINVESAPQANTMHLVFHDEFDKLSLNTGTAATAQNTWKTSFIGGERNAGGVGEAQRYVDPDYKGSSTQSLGINPFSVNDGVLTISARPADAADAPYLYSSKYTSGLLTSEKSFVQTYGYYEIRADMPGEKGMHPAFWLLPTDRTWPPELDVVESSGDAPYFFSNAVHTTERGAFNPFVKENSVAPRITDGFHTYAMDWTKETISFYFDNKLTYQVATPSDLHKPMYMLVNLAVGGPLAGQPDATTDWSQADFKVDYVRVYSHDVAAATAPKVMLSNDVDALHPTKVFTAAATGPGTSTTYKVGAMGMAGADNSATVTVAYDANNALTLTNNGAWNAIKNATVNSTANGTVTIKNFVDAEITFGDGRSDVTVEGAKRGTISTGNADDRVTVNATSNTNDQNVMKIDTDGGNDDIMFNGAWNTKTSILSGDGADEIMIKGGAYGTVNAGAGDDQIVVLSTGQVAIVSGAGNDLLQLSSVARATVSDFDVAHDQIVITGATSTNVHVSVINGNTVIDANGPGLITLEHVTNPAAVDIHFA
jgi:beta-glucanase (GH16 family)